MKGSTYPKKYFITCRIIGEICLHVKPSYMINDMSYITRNDFMIQLRTIKILTETNQKTDRNWLKTLCHRQGPSKSRSLSSNRRSLSSKLKSPSFTRSLTWRVHIYIYTYLYLYYIYLSLSLSSNIFQNHPITSNAPSFSLTVLGDATAAVRPFNLKTSLRSPGVKGL